MAVIYETVFLHTCSMYRPTDERFMCQINGEENHLRMNVPRTSNMLCVSQARALAFERLHTQVVSHF